MRIALTGSHGFVGSAVAREIEATNHTLVPIISPRLSCTGPNQLIDLLPYHHELAEIENSIRGCDVLINCAGDPDASSTDRRKLLGANSMLPGLLATAARQAQVNRFIHVSTAAVQGRTRILDESENLTPFSLYSWTKALGEVSVINNAVIGQYTIYRPPSVHAKGRRVTESLRKLSRSPLSSVAGYGAMPTPQALLENVASAIVYLATTETTPPSVTMHPWEGLTTSSLMQLLGDHEPHHIPTPIAKGVLTLLYLAGRLHPSILTNTRRIEMCWFGQQQKTGWLTSIGWGPPIPANLWHEYI